MALRLIVMRHAKSSWESGAASDHDRPLNERGRHDAPRVAARLAELGWSPDVVLSSDSVRTRETWDAMAGELPPPADVQFRGSLYHAGAGPLRPLLANLASDVGTVLALGHNPGWEHVVATLTGEAITLKTAGAVLMENWSESWHEAADRRDWKIVEVIRPKEID
jgi:phosphohistidine phosphatase SixA